MNAPLTTILIMAGGTGGHVFPALAVAERLRADGVSVVWLGTHRGLEADVVPRAGLPIEWIRVSGLRGKGLGRRLSAPFMLLLALIQAFAVLLRVRPQAVLGMGGFVTGPGGVAAWVLRRPLLLHEQNSVAGLTNRLLVPLATRLMEAFPGALPASRKPVLTGNPVRDDIAALPAPEMRFADRTGALRLLVLGGSLGARALNETVPAALQQQPPESRPTVWHQCGRLHADAARESYRQAGVEARVEPFITDMAEAYGWADLVLCRAGALTVAELSAAGLGAILVPYPYAVDDHQTSNARYLADAAAAVLVPQNELTAQRLATLLVEHGERGHLLAMARNARGLARPDAAREVAALCLAAAREGRS
ncbi:MAG: undecaprenyldiphospho-muramoylpentapeptide beta-N-acetylglucosaminyltransferase [Gammaproteobacteria bacterium]|jgi:UDP-N-acetylglucosamine--N-acetylmuramyl-(pentapeptide) pyrophosphoryl-undecaprenol N-acetylglucosamine transferase